MGLKSKVLHVSPGHPANDPRIVYKQAPALAEVYEVICLLPGPLPAHYPESIHVVRLPHFRRLGWRLLLVHPLILLHIIRFRPAVLHIYMPELLPIALICRAVMGLKVIYEVQENLRLKFDRKSYNNHWLFQRAFGAFDRLARRFCYFIFTDDSYLTEYPHLRFPSVVVHNYPDVPFIHQFRSFLPIPVSQPEFVYLGLISFDRGLDTMIRAIALLKPDYPTIRLHLIGRCLFPFHQLEGLPDYALVRKNLLFYGQTGHAEAMPIAARCLAGLALLKPVGDYPQSYPTKVFEYMALGLPVIASDFLLYRSLIEPNQCGFCVDAEQPQDVVNRLRWLINHADERNVMGQQGYQAVKTYFSWAIERQTLLKFYQLLK